MQIKFNSVLVLAGEWTESTADLSREVATQIQRAEFLRGTEPSWFDRGNYSATLTWKTQRLFASIVEAELFFLEHGDNEGTSTSTELTGIVEFIMQDEIRTQRRYARGRLSIRFGTPIGVHVDTFYNLEYGRLSKTQLTADE